MEKHQHDKDANVLGVLKWNSDQTFESIQWVPCLLDGGRYERNESLCFMKLETSKTRILNAFL
jgi:hypothetical protein